VEPGSQTNGSYISRFTLRPSEPPLIDAGSEKVIIRWLSGGHNGCTVAFGNDGFLYFSTGDAANPDPPDIPYKTGQDISDLLSSIVRIDVDHSEGTNAYAIPHDNPFLKIPGARPEVYAFGLRNPWRMSFDGATGDLWVGDVGWEQWEMVYRVKAGGNYGWSITEGPNTHVRTDVKPGPGPILPARRVVSQRRRQHHGRTRLSRPETR
jgi:glucose/arabinose dehydrogenase